MLQSITEKFGSTKLNLTRVPTPWGEGETDNPVVEYSIAGAIILGAAGLCWRTITGGK